MNQDDINKISAAWRQVVEKKKLDPVNDKENDKKFKDREDKDIDNDGDVDSSDEYLHKRRKATDDAIDGGKKPATNESKKGKIKSDDEMSKEKDDKAKGWWAAMDKKNGKKGVKESVRHAEFGYGEVLSEDGDNCDVLFDHGVEFNVARTQLEGCGYKHMKKESEDDSEKEEPTKEKGSKKSKKKGEDVPPDYDDAESAGEVKESTVAEESENVAQAYSETQTGMRKALAQMWEAATAKQGSNNYKEKALGDDSRHSQGAKVRADHDYDNPKVVDTHEKNPDIVDKAGSATKQAPARRGDQQVGDKAIVKPVKKGM